VFSTLVRRSVLVPILWQLFAASSVFGQQDRVLAGTRNRNAKIENDRGPLNASRVIGGMSLIFNRTAAQAADLARLLEEQQDPNSPNYHAWLTGDQYADRFGLTPAEFARVVAWLEAEGLRVDYVSRSRTWVMFSGAAGQIQSAFHTEIHRYEMNGESHFANATDPSIPAALAPLIWLVRGLDDFRIAPPRVKLKPAPDYTSGGSHALTPGDVGTIYDINALYQDGFTGSGQKIAVAGQTDIYLSDIEAFRTEFGLPSNNPELVLVAGSPDPGVSSDDLFESSLDLEYAGGVAPNATVIFVYSTDVFTSVAYAVDEDLAPLISLSYGGCEPEISSSPASTGAYLQYLAQQANALGVTWLSSSGDAGAAACDIGSGIQSASHGLAVNLPASVPQVTAVGGTEFNEGAGTYWSATNNANLSSALSYIPEIAWNDTAVNVAAGGGLAATGGGASILFSKPSWQTGTGVPNDGVRDVPDVSFDASNDHDPYLIYVNGEFWYVGGTSVATPVFSAVLALLNQYLVSNGILSQAGLGNINPTLYRLSQTTTGVFHDITAGNNIVPCVNDSPNCSNGQLGYSAGPGYDQTTGLGSLDAYNLATQWAASLAGATTTAVVANPLSLASNGSTVLTATVRAISGTTSPTGSVSFAAGETALGTGTLSGSGGSATANLTVNASQLSSGSNLIAASYEGSPGFLASSGSVTVNVNGGATSCNYSLSADSISVGPGAGNATVNVQTADGCAWTASSNAAWLTVTSGSSGSGDGTVDYSFAANTGETALIGTLTIAAQTFTVTQAETPPPLAFYPLTPCRIADTRVGFGFSGAFGPPSLVGAATRSFPIPQSACNVAATAQAYSLNITVLPPGALGYLTAWPTGSATPEVSTINAPEGGVVANAAIVSAGTDGAVSLYASSGTDVLIDINGYFAPPGEPQALTFYSVTPCRVADTRTGFGFSGAFGPPSLVGGATRDFPVQESSCGISSAALVYSVRMTALAPGPLGYLTTWPEGQTLPNVSTLNAPNGGVVGNQAFVPAGTETGGPVSVFASDNTDLLIDINGYLAPSGNLGALQFYPLAPCRVADTRAGFGFNGAFGQPSLVAGATRNFPLQQSSCGIPSSAQAYSMNLTAVVPPGGELGYLTAFPAGETLPNASTLNAPNGGVVASGAIVPAGSDGSISVFASNATDLLIDINGYFAP
jgi:Pro-kumamolisin, activation domain/Bacterial Ig-like domain (group 3)/Putative binding domain, N-terminal